MEKNRITFTLCSYGIIVVEEVDTPMEYSLKLTVPEDIWHTIHPILMGIGATFSSEEDYLLYQFGDKENPNGDPEGTIATVLEKIIHLFPEAEEKN